MKRAPNLGREAFRNAKEHERYAKEVEEQRSQVWVQSRRDPHVWTVVKCVLPSIR